MVYCNDVDLMNWEPNIFKGASAVAQTLISGTGDLAGTSFTISSGSLAASQVSARCAAFLEGAINSTLAIVSVDSDTQMTVSVLWGDLSQPVESKTGSGIPYSVRTFSAQSKLISDIFAGMIDGTITNAEVLRRPTALGTLMLIYRALGATTSNAGWLARADLYERLYQRALRSVKLEIDTNGDGIADVTRDLQFAQFVRA